MRRSLITKTVLAAALGLSALATPALAQVQPYGTNDYGGFRNILPPGPMADVQRRRAARSSSSTGTYPPHCDDQLRDVREPGLRDARPDRRTRSTNFFKDAQLRRPGRAGRAHLQPARRADDRPRRNFGVAAHLRRHAPDTMFGAGYVGAEDRLFFMDVLRHAGRAPALGLRRAARTRRWTPSVWAIAPYTEADLQKQIDLADELYGAEGAQLQQDLADYVAGINQYISEARTDPTQDAGRVRRDRQAARGLEGHRRDRDRLADRRHLRQGRRQRGRQRRSRSRTPRHRFGGAAGEQAWHDFRRPTTPRRRPRCSGNGSFDYPATSAAPPGVGAAATRARSSTRRTAARARAGRRPAGGCSAASASSAAMSNALLVSGAESESGHPVAVMGPQVAYFMPQILMEEDLHGPDIDAQRRRLRRRQPLRAARPRPGLRLVGDLGRPGHHRHLRREALRAGRGSPGRCSRTHYLYKGQCRAMEILDAGQQHHAEPGRPVAARDLHARGAAHRARDRQQARHRRRPAGRLRASQRSTYFHEADSARGFADLNRPSKVQNVQDFQQRRCPRSTSPSTGSTPTTRTSATSTRATTRCARRAPTRTSRPGAPGEYDWKGWDPDDRLVHQTPPTTRRSPSTRRSINQDYITSLEQQAGARLPRRRRTTTPTGRSTARSRSTSGSSSGIAGADKMSLPELIDAMEDAGTVDLRGTQVLPLHARGDRHAQRPAASARRRATRSRPGSHSGAHRRDQRPGRPLRRRRARSRSWTPGGRRP